MRFGTQTIISYLRRIYIEREPLLPTMREAIYNHSLNNPDTYTRKHLDALLARWRSRIEREIQSDPDTLRLLQEAGFTISDTAPTRPPPGRKEF
jgi:hypothetical protein